MKDNQLPLVSVPVITYNSSKTVIETLDSIYNQTYPNLELIVSDDGSTDNTVQVCREWVEAHKDRFVRADILTVEKNTGISANLNRAEKACRGEWVKGIAGDDRLLPDCIRSFVSYVLEHDDVYCVFGKIKAFDGNKKDCELFTKIFSNRNDEMSSMNSDELLLMIQQGNTPPAPAFFYNRNYLLLNQIENDERIPNIEDLPKWLTMLEKGIRFYFLDQFVVEYRFGGISTSQQWDSLPMYKNKRLLYFYYQFAPNYSKDAEQAIQKAVSDECAVYERVLALEQEINEIRNSILFRIGRCITTPFRKIQKKWRIIRR